MSSLDNPQQQYVDKKNEKVSEIESNKIQKSEIDIQIKEKYCQDIKIFQKNIQSLTPSLNICDHLCTSVHRLSLPNKNSLLQMIEQFDDFASQGQQNKANYFFENIKYHIMNSCEQKLNDMGSVGLLSFNQLQSMSSEFPSISSGEKRNEKKNAFTSGASKVFNEVFGVQEAHAATKKEYPEDMYLHDENGKNLGVLDPVKITENDKKYNFNHFEKMNMQEMQKYLKSKGLYGEIEITTQDLMNAKTKWETEFKPIFEKKDFSQNDLDVYDKVTTMKIFELAKTSKENQNPKYFDHFKTHIGRLYNNTVVRKKFAEDCVSESFEGWCATPKNIDRAYGNDDYDLNAINDKRRFEKNIKGTPAEGKLNEFYKKDAQNEQKARQNIDKEAEVRENFRKMMKSLDRTKK